MLFSTYSNRNSGHRREVAGPLQVGRVLRAFPQRSVANRDDGRIITEASRVIDGPGNVLDQRLEIVSCEPWLGERKPRGGVGRIPAMQW